VTRIDVSLPRAAGDLLALGFLVISSAGKDFRY